MAIQNTLKSKILQNNWMNRLVCAAYVIAVLFTWPITYNLLKFSSFGIASMLDLYDVSVATQIMVGWILLVIFLIAMTLYGWTREHTFLDCSGWHNSPFHVEPDNAMSRDAAMAHVILEFLLIAPIATREMLKAFRIPNLPSDDQLLDQADAVYRDLQLKADWVPRGIYHEQMEAVELLAKLQMIRMMDRQGVPVVRVPSIV